EAHRLGGPDEAGDDDEPRQLAEAHGREHALFEAIVELEDPMRQGQRHDHPPAEVPHRQQPRGEGEDDADADRAHDLDLVGQAAAERPITRGEAEDDEREEDQQDEREDERADRAPLAQPAAQRQLVGGDPVGSPILAGPPLDAAPSIRFKRDGLLVATVAAASSLLTGPPLVIRRTRRLSRPVQAAHRSTGTDRSRAGRTLPLPRARWTTFA